MGIELTKKIPHGTLPGVLFILFFCDDIFATFIARTIGSGFITPVYCLLFFTLLVLAIIAKKDKSSLMIPIMVYGVVFLLFFFTYLIHPEYSDWFSHSIYGIVPALLSPRSGIWAFLIIWLINDEDELYALVRFSAWILLILYILQYMVSTARGYWIIREIDGTVRNDRYSLEYGYNVLFPVAFFGSEFFLQSKKIYLIPYLLGTVMIFTGGSRGAIIWAVAMFIIMLPFKWHNIDKKKRVWFVFIFVVLFLAAVLVYMNYQIILIGISSVLSRYGISSRTLSSLMLGSFSDGNGRDKIFSMAVELIKEGGLFGHGVYGDRYTIGNYFKWGYSHNIFLELFVSFGYLGGMIASVALISGIVRLYKSCNTKQRQIVFITFLITSCKLLLSNSFWYTAAFWALLALMLKWNTGRQFKISINRG